MDTNIGQKVTAFDQNNRNLLSRHTKKRNQKDNLEVIFDLRSNLFTLLSMNIYVFTCTTWLLVNLSRYGQFLTDSVKMIENDKNIFLPIHGSRSSYIIRFKNEVVLQFVRYFCTLLWDDIIIMWDENIVYFFNWEKNPVLDQ